MTKKITWIWSITKAVEKQAGYLLSGSAFLPKDTTNAGEEEFVVNYSAWTTLGAAKRHAATSMGRSRVRWDEKLGTDFPDQDGDVWVAYIDWAP